MNLLDHQDNSRTRLVDKAKNRAIVSYSELFIPYGLNMSDPSHRIAATEVLCAIGKAEYQAGRPLLTAVVISKESGQPGEGLYTLARELEIINGKISDDKKMLFFTQTLSAVYEHWAPKAKE